MNTDSTRKGREGGKDKVIFKQYITGKSPNSVRAVLNLKAICKKHFTGTYIIQTIDVTETPLVALRDEVYVSPTLIKISPPPLRRIIGDLSDELTVMQALELEAS